MERVNTGGVKQFEYKGNERFGDTESTADFKEEYKDFVENPKRFKRKRKAKIDKAEEELIKLEKAKRKGKYDPVSIGIVAGLIGGVWLYKTNKAIAIILAVIIICGIIYWKFKDYKKRERLDEEGYR